MYLQAHLQPHVGMMMTLVTGWLAGNVALIVWMLHRHIRCEQHQARVGRWLEAVYAELYQPANVPALPVHTAVDQRGVA